MPTHFTLSSNFNKRVYCRDIAKLFRKPFSPRFERCVWVDRYGNLHAEDFEIGLQDPALELRSAKWWIRITPSYKRAAYEPDCAELLKRRVQSMQASGLKGYLGEL